MVPIKKKNSKNTSLAGCFRLPSRKTVYCHIEVVDDVLVSWVHYVVHEHVGVEAEVEPLPEVDLVNEALVAAGGPGVGLDNARGLQVEQVEKLLQVCQIIGT